MGVRLGPSPAPDEAPWDRARRVHLVAARHEAARLPSSAAFSHITAAAAHDFPMRMSRYSARVHVTAPSDSARRVRRGLIVHPIARDLRRVTQVDGLTVTHPIDTWCALSAIVTLDELVAIGDYLVKRENPMATMDQLNAAVHGSAGRHGAKVLREALALVRPRTDSSKETEIRLHLVRGGLPEPAINLVIHDRAGRRIRRGDMVYEDYKVLVEYDGEQHRTDSDQYDKDADHVERMTHAGWLVVRFRKNHARNPSLVVGRVRAALRAHGYPGAPPLLPFTNGFRRDEGAGSDQNRS
ncbi:MAG: DUF559 domain-containing protein [Actinobacteria bacterium]|nr:DUF559 domain-containing protein [Actinomycetota bacterium]